MVVDPEADSFLTLSAELTGFGKQELLGTGSADGYRDWLSSTFPKVFADLLSAWEKIEREYPDPPSREEPLRQRIFEDPYLGPFVKNTLVLWYTATWEELEKSWAEQYGQPEVTARVFGEAYPETLAPKAAGAHPIGANPTGFGSWSRPPAQPSQGKPA